MIELALPVWSLWVLRWALLLVPLTAVLVLARKHRHDSRALVGGLFAFLYGFGTIFVTHELAAYVGWWRYGGLTLMFRGIPADILIGGALAFGPVLALAFPKLSPLLLLTAIVICLHGMLFLSLPPLLYPGPNWFSGVLVVFATAHLPALYLARWTATGRHLPLRAAILAIGFGCLAFVVLPSAIMEAMGGNWELLDRSPFVLAGGVFAIAICCVLGLAAVQMFALYGKGTAIPLDPTERLVRVGIFAYVRNPMQLCSALVWIILGLMLRNIWVASAAAMAWVFVAGMVRWHHRYDLLLRFREDWTEYITYVPEWYPRWRPWIKYSATLTYDPSSAVQSVFVCSLQRLGTTSLVVRPDTNAMTYYCDAEGVHPFYGLGAAAMALHHTQFAAALIGATILLIVLPVAFVRTQFAACPLIARLGRAA